MNELDIPGFAAEAALVNADKSFEQKEWLITANPYSSRLLYTAIL